MRDVDEVGGATGVGGVQVADVQPEVVHHAQRSEPGRVTGAEIAVHVLQGEAGVGERAARALRMQLRGGLVGGLARRMLVGPDDAGLASNGHVQMSW